MLDLMVGDIVKIIHGEHEGKVGNVIKVRSGGVVISVSFNGASYVFNHNDLLEIVQDSEEMASINVNEDMAYVTSEQVLFTVSRDNEVLFECRDIFHAHMAKNEIERLESEIAQLKTQIAEMHAAAMWKAGNGRTYCKACKGNWKGDVICPFERKTSEEDNADGTG